MDSSPRGFDFTAAMRALCRDMVARLPELAHVDLDRVAIGVVQARRNVSHGTYAALTPLRFEGGRSEGTVRGRRYRVQPLTGRGGQDFLYLLTFYLPRFLNTSLEEKLSTVVHELWHIGPQFDGDLRRHEGRCYAHGPSKKDYDAQMDRLAQQWLAADPPLHVYEFLQHTFAELQAEHGPIAGDSWPAPKLIPA
ncbi:MAG: hypothetical protein CMJ58_20120 [Planctomycetaceae bacterium]|nr:hypothetical protein [Planctomycetaceae bacterium]